MITVNVWSHPGQIHDLVVWRWHEFAPQAIVEIRYTGCDEATIRAWLGDCYDYCEQGEGDLGQRMSRAFEYAFYGEGMQRVLVVGSDIPGIDRVVLEKAFKMLRKPGSDVVIGPAEDGGYYLVCRWSVCVCVC